MVVSAGILVVVVDIKSALGEASHGQTYLVFVKVRVVVAAGSFQPPHDCAIADPARAKETIFLYMLKRSGRPDGQIVRERWRENE